MASQSTTALSYVDSLLADAEARVVALKQVKAALEPVIPTNLGPIELADYVLAEGTVGKAYATSLLGTADPEGKPLTYEITQLPEGIKPLGGLEIAGILLMPGRFEIRYDAIDDQGLRTPIRCVLPIKETVVVVPLLGEPRTLVGYLANRPLYYSPNIPFLMDQTGTAPDAIVPRGFNVPYTLLTTVKTRPTGPISGNSGMDNPATVMPGKSKFATYRWRQFKSKDKRSYLEQSPGEDELDTVVVEPEPEPKPNPIPATHQLVESRPTHFVTN